MALERFSNGKYNGWLDPSLRIPRELLEDPGSAESYTGSELLLNCRGRVIVRVSLEVDGEGRNCFLYLFRNRSFGRSLRSSYAFHIMRIARRLRQRGFETLDVLGALRPRGQFLNWDSLLIAREILQVVELPSTGQHVFQIHDSVAFDAFVASTVAHELAVFHNSGFVHGDLKSRHVLIQNSQSQDRAKVVLVDLEKAKWFSGLLGPAHDLFAARDLIQLIASLPIDSAPSCLRETAEKFLEEYFESRKVGPRRSRLMRRIIGLYGPRGRFQQGRTLLQCLFGEIPDGRHSNAPGHERPPAPIGPARPPRPRSADTAHQSEPS